LCCTLIIAQKFDLAQEVVDSIKGYWNHEEIQVWLDQERAKARNNGDAV
jgi:hypothetical protein